jgi:hypothetical protein
VTYETAPYDKQRNNIYLRRWVADYGSDIANSFIGQLPNSPYTITNPGFVGSGLANPELHFQLTASSPCRNIGVTSFVGANGVTITDCHPDAGAYKYNDINDRWVPGYVAVPYVSTPIDQETTAYTIDNVNVANVYTGSWQHFDNLSWTQTMINKTVSVATASGAELTTAFVGDNVEWWAEKRENHAIVGVSIDGGAETMVDLYAATTVNGSQMVYSAGLTQGNHTIRLRLTNTRNVASTGSPFAYSMAHDAFKIETS